MRQEHNDSNWKYKKKYTTLKNFIGEDPYDFCLRKINTRVADALKGFLDEKARDYFESNALYRKDKRSCEEFAQDLVMSRVMELYLIDYFSEVHNRNYKLGGCDSEDILDTKNKVTTDPDFITEEGTFIEVVSDKFDFWSKNNGFDLRDYKYNNLKKHSDNRKTYILAVDIKNRRYQFIKVDDGLKVQKVKNIKEFGGKNGYHIELDEHRYKYIEKKE